MNEDIYLKLGMRLNQYQMKMMLDEPFLTLLKEFYTEEQAELGARFPMGGHTARELSQELKREEGELTAFLETMADSGLVFVTKTEPGKVVYSLTPFVPGVWEFQLMRGTDTPRDRKIARMLFEFMKSLGTKLHEMGDVVKDPKLSKKLMGEPPTRTITVQKELPRGIEIYPFEELTKLVAHEDSFAASKCYCRHQAYLLDHPCKVEGVPEYSCLSFGKVADFVVDRKFGKRVSREDCLEILDLTEKAGLVHNTANASDSSVFVCNCCGCCCGFLMALKKFDHKALVAPSNFQAAVDEQSCSGCGDCIDRCQVEAIELAGEVASINTQRCLGCGNCVSVCPTESLSLVRISHVKPPEAGDAFIGMGR